MGAGGVVLAALGFVGEKAVAGFRGQQDDEGFEDEVMVRDSEQVAAQARAMRKFGEKQQFQRLEQQTLPQQPRKENTKPGLIERMARSRWNPMRRLTDQEYEDMLREKLIRVEAEIAIVDDEVVKLEALKMRERKAAVEESAITGNI